MRHTLVPLKARTRRRRRGSTALMAVVFLTLFAALAVGFYSQVTTSVQISGNEQRANRAMLAADSGMQFMKYHLATLGIPANTQPALLFDKVYESLGTKLNNYPNMPANARTIELDDTGTLIYIPKRPEPGAFAWIGCDADGGGFRAELRKLQAGEKIEVRVFGRFGGNSANARGLKLEYANFPNPAAIFNYGVASESAISMNGNVTIRGTVGNEHMGSVLSTHAATAVPLTMTGSPEISGHVSFTNPNATPSISNQSSIANLSPGDQGFSDVIHRGVPRPEFPVVDTTAFLAYGPSATAAVGTPGVVSSATPTGTYFKNIRIKANTNPTFASNTLLQGVVIIEQPNRVKFSGGATIQGAIVTPTDGSNNAGTNLTNNEVEFMGGVSFQSVSTLPATSDFPLGLRQLTGSGLLIPGFKAEFAGNFNTINGTLIASQFEFRGTAGGTIKGSVINLRDSALVMSGTADIVIESQGTGNHPAGVYFGSHYSPLPYTYQELAAQ